MAAASALKVTMQPRVALSVVAPMFLALLVQCGADVVAPKRELFDFLGGVSSFTAEKPQIRNEGTGSIGGKKSSDEDVKWDEDFNPFSPLTAATSNSERERLKREGEKSTQIASGIMEGFLHKQQLEPGELKCLVEGSGQVAGDLGVTAARVVELLEQMLGFEKKTPQEETSGSSRSSVSQQSNSKSGTGADDISAQIDAMMRNAEARSQSTKPAVGALPALPKAQPAVIPSKPQQASFSERPASTVSTGTGKTQPAADATLGFFYGGRRLNGMKMNAATMMGSASMMMELAFTAQQLMQLTHDIMQNCVHGDALAAFRTAMEHMKNLEYLEGHMMAAGADIVVELADAVMDYGARRYREFGQDIGKAMRKVLLSKDGNSLPEGLPNSTQLATISAGVVKGFFGPGFKVDITTPDSPDPIEIDMNKCVSKNLKFFQSIYASTMVLVAKKEAEANTKSKTFGEEKEAAEFGTMLIFTMMQLPQALKRCNLGPEQEKMLMDAVKALGSGSSIHIESPGGIVNKEEVATEMAKTIKAYGTHQYGSFGQDLGKLMQGLTKTMFPRLYTVRDGRLRRQLELLESTSMTSAADASNGIVLPLGLTLTVVLLLMAVVALKSRRTLAAWKRQWCNQTHDGLMEDPSVRDELDLEVSRSLHGPMDAVE